MSIENKTYTFTTILQKLQSWTFDSTSKTVDIL